MKKYLSNKVLTLLLIVFTVPFLIAAVSNFRGGLEVHKAGDAAAVWWIDADGNLQTAAGETPVEYIDFMPSDFKRTWTGSDVVPDSSLKGTYSPVLKQEGDAHLNYPYIGSYGISAAVVWPMFHPNDRLGVFKSAGGYLTKLDFSRPPGDEETPAVAVSPSDIPDAISPIQVMFKVPENYRTGGQFVLTAHQYSIRTTQTTGAPVKVGYQVFKTTPTNYMSESAYTYKPVAVGTAGYLLSPTEVTLAITGTSLSAGEWVTFQYWRIRDLAVADDLRVLAARFYYNPEY